MNIDKNLKSIKYRSIKIPFSSNSQFIRAREHIYKRNRLRSTLHKLSLYFSQSNTTTSDPVSCGSLLYSNLLNLCRSTVDHCPDSEVQQPPSYLQWSYALWIRSWLFYRVAALMHCCHTSRVAELSIFAGVPEGGRDSWHRYSRSLHWTHRTWRPVFSINVGWEICRHLVEWLSDGK